MAHTTHERRNRHQGLVALENRTEFCVDMRLGSGQLAPVCARGPGITRTDHTRRLQDQEPRWRLECACKNRSEPKNGNTKSAAHSSKPNTGTERKQRFSSWRTLSREQKLVREKRNPLAGDPRPGGERKPNHELCPATTDKRRSDRISRGKNDQKNQSGRTWKSRPALAGAEKWWERMSRSSCARDEQNSRTKNLRTRSPTQQTQLLDPVNIKRSTSSTNERQNGFFYWS
jgi:hypothetical protein